MSDRIAGAVAVEGLMATPSRWQRFVALARLLRDQLRRYREVAPVAGGFGEIFRARLGWVG